MTSLPGLYSVQSVPYQRPASHFHPSLFLPLLSFSFEGESSTLHRGKALTFQHSASLVSCHRCPSPLDKNPDTPPPHPFSFRFRSTRPRRLAWLPTYLLRLVPQQCCAADPSPPDPPHSPTVPDIARRPVQLSSVDTWSLFIIPTIGAIRPALCRPVQSPLSPLARGKARTIDSRCFAAGCVTAGTYLLLAPTYDWARLNGEEPSKLITCISASLTALRRLTKPAARDIAVRADSPPLRRTNCIQLAASLAQSDQTLLTWLGSRSSVDTAQQATPRQQHTPILPRNHVDVY